MVIKIRGQKMIGFSKEGIQERIEQLDEDVSNDYLGDGRFQVVIVGGGALIVCGYLARSTDDIDVLAADSRLLELMSQYNMNSGVNAFMNNFPYNYEDRLVLLWSGKKVDYYTASLEDIVISKLCSNRGDDLTDLENIVHHIDWNKLEYLATNEDEIKKSIMSSRGYMDFEASYEIFERRFRPCKD